MRRIEAVAASVVGLVLICGSSALTQAAKSERAAVQQVKSSRAPPQTTQRFTPQTNVPPLPRARPLTPAAPEPKSQPAPPAADQRRDVAAETSAPGQARLNMVRTAPEQIGQVPNHFFWIREGLQAAQDPVDGSLVFITDEGRIAGRANLPSAFTIDEVIAEAGQVRLVDGSRRQLSIPRNIDPAAVTTLQETSIAAYTLPRTTLLTRRGPQHLILNDSRRAGFRALDIRSLANGQLAQAYEVSSGGGAERYVVTEEIVASKPALDVRVFVQRFNAVGKLVAAAHVPLEGMDVVPRDFIAVTGQGVLRALVPAPDGIKIREIEFTDVPTGRQKRALDPNSLGRSLREVPVDTNLDRPPGIDRLLRGGMIRFRISPPTPPISRADVIRNASAYLSINWVMEPENFSRPGIDNACVPSEARFWRRPTRFTQASIGQTIGPMPYRWGGDDTPETFRLRLAWGALAGSICTCRDPALDYCLSPESIGVDCSGLVSRAWGIEKRGTSGLMDVSVELSRISEIKPGDAFNWPGRHIRLFVGMAPGAAQAFTVVESSTRRECEGACMRTYRPSELYGYRVIRYRGISN